MKKMEMLLKKIFIDKILIGLIHKQKKVKQWICTYVTVMYVTREVSYKSIMYFT